MTIEEAIEHAREVAEGCPAGDRQCAYQHDKLADWLEELKAYRETGLTPEDVKSVAWIYRPINWTGCDLERVIEEAEKALGFKLFFWQKAYILFGEFRQMGATTAEILRDLLNISAEPIDYTRRAVNERQQFYRRELREIKAKLDGAGIPTRAVFFSERDKHDYSSKQKKGESHFRCRAKLGEYCKKWDRTCVGWKDCGMEDYGAPCPGCRYSSPKDNKKCASCEHKVWKEEKYIP